MVADDAKVVLITGASQGIGQAIAYEIAKHGQKLIINFIAGCEEDAEKTVARVKELGGDAIAIQVSHTPRHCKRYQPPCHVELIVCHYRIQAR